MKRSFGLGEFVPRRGIFGPLFGRSYSQRGKNLEVARYRDVDNSYSRLSILRGNFTTSLSSSNKRDTITRNTFQLFRFVSVECWTDSCCREIRRKIRSDQAQRRNLLPRGYVAFDNFKSRSKKPRKRDTEERNNCLFLDGRTDGLEKKKIFRKLRYLSLFTNGWVALSWQPTNFNSSRIDLRQDLRGNLFQIFAERSTTAFKPNLNRTGTERKTLVPT